MFYNYDFDWLNFIPLSIVYKRTMLHNPHNPTSLNQSLNQDSAELEEPPGMVLMTVLLMVLLEESPV